MAFTPYKVVAYNIDELIKLLAEGSLANLTEVSEKLHRIYFEGYFGGIQARTIVVEYEYIDRYFLEDFSSYYVKCFESYERKCTRLHFFGIAFSQRKFSLMLSGKSPAFRKALQDSYLGFIVVKKLPKTIIGRTCLTTYPQEGGRCFPVNRKYEVNLFGLKLNVQTLAYQEQDSVVAACATSALWSIFHRTGMMFHHHIPTPVEITKAATYNFPAEERNLPNQGLTLEQMAHAIRNVGLEPYPVKVQNEFLLQSTIYAYVKAGVPLAMAIALYDTSTTPHQFVGMHAIAVSGFNVSSSAPIPLNATGFLSKSTRINKIYAHDDQVGPFARMELDNSPGTFNIDNEPTAFGFSLSTSWKGQDGVVGSVRAAPTAVLVPLYNKMRIPLSKVEGIVINFDAIIETFRSQGFFPMLSERLEWGIYLSSLNDLKADILLSDNIASDQRREILVDSMPRFLWCAIASMANSPIMVLIFDATDIEQGNFFIRAVKYEESFYNVLKTVISQPHISPILKSQSAKMVFEWIEGN